MHLLKYTSPEMILAAKADDTEIITISGEVVDSREKTDTERKNHLYPLV